MHALTVLFNSLSNGAGCLVPEIVVPQQEGGEILGSFDALSDFDAPFVPEIAVGQIEKPQLALDGFGEIPHGSVVSDVIPRSIQFSQTGEPLDAVEQTLGPLPVVSAL